jgi:hypothetical protein
MSDRGEPDIFGEEPAPKQSPVLKAAIEYYDDYGLNPLACALKQKSPLGQWKRYQSERIPRDTMVQSFSHGPRNIWAPCGAHAPGRLLALDCDSAEALEHWMGVLGDELKGTACVATGGGGHHFLFRAPEGSPLRSVNARTEDHDPRNEWEIKADGTGVVLPPSLHESGKAYRWVRSLAERLDAPEALLQPLSRAGDAPGGGSDTVRSMLANLLRDPPTEGNRNVWLAKVAGHLAKHIPYRDAYDALVDIAAPGGLEPEEIAKLKDSVWNTEMNKPGRETPMPEEWEPEPEPVSRDNGWCASGGDCIVVQCSVGKGEDQVLRSEELIDADLRVEGVIAGEEEREYIVTVRRARDHAEITGQRLPASTIVDTRSFPKWLSVHGVTRTSPRNMHGEMERGERIVRYLETQGAPVMETVSHLGWYGDTFIHHDGIIRRDGPDRHENVRPDPSVRGWAPYRYGHGDRDAAQELLRKVLTFHDEEVAAVFGAWWAAVFLKPIFHEVSSQFPFMALEAPSETGKTTGYFPIMLQLAGHTSKQINPTRAALRDYLTAHNSGIVWVDDRDDVEDLGELLRQVTVGGVLVKKAGDNTKQVEAVMRAALVIAGEGLGLGDQKALMDRAVLLEVPSPKERLTEDGRPQWEEISEVRAEHPEMTEFAGVYVQLAAENAAIAKGLSQYKEGSGRHVDKIAIVRCGARLLSALAGDDGWWEDRVDRWASQQVDVGSENTLTLRAIPLALARTGWKNRPDGPYQNQLPTPAFVESEDAVWFSPRWLAESLKLWNHGRVSARTETESAFMQQAKALGLGGPRNSGWRRKWRFSNSDVKANYWRLTPDLSQRVLERSREEIHGEDQDSFME